MPGVVAVVLIIGIMAAAVSTVDSILLALASIVSCDIYRLLARDRGGTGELARHRIW